MLIHFSYCCLIEFFAHRNIPGAFYVLKRMCSRNSKKKPACTLPSMSFFVSISHIITNISDGLWHYMFYSITVRLFNRPFNHILCVIHRNTCTNIWNTCSARFFASWRFYFRCLTTVICTFCTQHMANESPENWIVSTRHSYFCSSFKLHRSMWIQLMKPRELGFLFFWST